MKANLKQKSVEKVLHRDYEGQVEAKTQGESPSLRA